MDECVYLKPGKEIPVLRRHPWVFSGAVAKLPIFEEGEILPICSSKGERLGWGMFNRRSSIIGRMVSFNPSATRDEIIPQAISDAVNFRLKWINGGSTTAYRLVNAEGDGLPGLIIDRYGDYLVMQVHALGIERVRSKVIETLIKLLNPIGIYEKSNSPSRRQEGLKDRLECTYGTVPARVIIQENSLKFSVDFVEGQKTGLFLDQRAMRERIGELAKDRRILNCFSYTGGFSLYALHGGAAFVDSVDISEKAVKGIEENILLNGLGDAKNWANHATDVFGFLKENPLDHDLIILDPPAFAKKKQDLKNACKGYRDLNRLAMQKVKEGALLLTCSCSQHLDEECFIKIIFEAALEAGRSVQILEKQRHGLDHPVSLFHPEGSYLKGLLLRISD